MAFARKVWNLLVAIKDGLVLIFLLLFFMALYGVLMSRPSPAAMRDGALVLRLNGTVVEEPATPDPLEGLLTGQAQPREHRARDVIRAIGLAGEDERVKAVVLDLSEFMGGGMVTLQEIGNALDKVRAKGKPVLAYSMAYTDDGMLLAAHASEVWVHPLGGAFVMGPGGDQLYFGGLLQRLKVKVHVYKVGTYKDFVEPYLLDKASESSRQARGAVLSALWEEWQADVAKARPKANLALVTRDPVGWLKGAGGDTAKAALSAGLVDKLGDEVAFGERVKAIAGEDRFDERPGSYAHNSPDALLAAHPAKDDGEAIAVVTVAGALVDGKAGPGTAGGERIARLIDEATASEAKALVLRVDSQGGSVFASEQIRLALERFKAKGRPIAVSMVNMAASGGYWVSTPAKRIFAQPGTVTGSIGIFAMLPSFEQTLGQYGVTSDGQSTTPLSGQPDVLGGISPEADAMIQASIENGYARFLGLVGKARGKTPEQIDAIAQGRVWDGGTARQNGLVDQFGGLDEALAWAAKEAKLEEWHPEFYGTEADPYGSLLDRLLGGEEEDGQAPAADFAGLMAQRQEARLAGGLAQVGWLLGTRGAQAYCLDCPVPLAGKPAPRGGGWLANLAKVLSLR
ncbi:MAG TPA: signal peptide peptidase SppA [Novosphingobium sp.]|nr:signal peptide peptidase SppA [Novosphingobium sp.]